MKGSANYQAHMLFKKSGINQIGKSKHAAKAVARKSIAAGSRSATWHSIGKRIGVHSYATADVYRDTWRHILQHARKNFGIKDIEKLTGEHIAAYLQSKIEEGVAHATFAQYASAAEKLETALNMYSQNHDRGKVYDFSSAISSTRQKAHEKLEKFSGYRDYSDPKALIANLKNDTHKLAARLQYEAGLRVKETNVIKAEQLLPNDRLRVEGGKGGKVRTVELSPALYKELEEKIEASTGGTFKFDEDSYRRDLKAAAEATSQEYHGSHGLRWNYAQEKFQEYQLVEGETYEEAEAHVSEDLGHNRPDITQHYLGY